MWHIVCEEFRYYKWVIAGAHLFCLLIFAQSLNLPEGLFVIRENIRIGIGFQGIFGEADAIGGLLLNGLTIFLVAMAIMGARGDKERVERFYAMLPVSTAGRALSRLAFIFLFMLSIALWWGIYLLLAPAGETLRWLHMLLATFGLGSSFIVVLMIHHDFGYYGKRRYKLINYALLALFIVAINLTLMLFSARTVFINFVRFFGSLAGAATFLLLWLGLAWLSVQVYQRRKSYLA